MGPLQVHFDFPIPPPYHILTTPEVALPANLAAQNWRADAPMDIVALFRIFNETAPLPQMHVAVSFSIANAASLIVH